MTVSSENKRDQYTCNGVLTVFPYTFRVLDETHIQVILTDTDGDETTLVLNTDYTVSDVGEASGGNITTISTYGEDYLLTFIRNVPLTQETDYVENDMFPSTSHENALDKVTMAIQEMSERLDRAMFLLKSSSYSGLELPDPVASEILAWKDDLSGLKNVVLENTGEIEVTDYIKTLLDDENMYTAQATLDVSSVSFNYFMGVM